MPVPDAADIFDAKLGLVGSHAEDSSAAITALGALLLKEGYVKDTFIQSTIDREKEFSTGLPMGRVNVALPHTDSVHVLKQGIAVGVFDKPVEFRVMGDPETRIPVRLVFLLAIKESKDQVKILQKMIDLLQRPSFLDGLACAKSAFELDQLLRSGFDWHP